VTVVDVVVVGAGPAGSAAAITLAGAGLDVLVVDKAAFPRDKCCGDGLTTGALRILERLEVEPGAIPSWQEVHDVHLRGPGGRDTIFPLPRERGVFAAVARRHELDAALLDRARAAGAKVADGHACTGARLDADRIALSIEGLGAVGARFAIGADGMWSPLRRLLGGGQPGYLGEWHAFRQYFTGVAPEAASSLWVWFEPDILPGYVWSFPLAGGAANVGFGVRRTAGAPTGDMKRLWPDLLARPHIREVLGERARPEAPHRAWPIPAAVERATLTMGRALFVGDAARACDPLTGEGIAQALHTGDAAARALLASGPFDVEGAGTAYRAAVQADLVADSRMASALATVMSRRWGADAAIRLAGASDWTRRNFARWLFEDYPRAYVATPRRWGRHSFAGPGAWSH
jgi:menaquinone-9 beta-reductase